VSLQGVLIHTALQRAGFRDGLGGNGPGYIVGENKTFAGQAREFDVTHTPDSDDADAHTRDYYDVLVADLVPAGLSVQLVPQPYPKVRIRG
jgi:hypothetical protein